MNTDTDVFTNVHNLIFSFFVIFAHCHFPNDCVPHCFTLFSRSWLTAGGAVILRLFSGLQILYKMTTWTQRAANLCWTSSLSYNQSQKNPVCNGITVHRRTGCHRACWLVSHALNKADITRCFLPSWELLHVTHIVLQTHASASMWNTCTAVKKCKDYKLIKHCLASIVQKQKFVMFRLLDLHSQCNAYHAFHHTSWIISPFFKINWIHLITQSGFTLSSVILVFKAFLRLLLGFHPLRFGRPSQGLWQSEAFHSSELAPSNCLLCSSVILTQTFIYCRPVTSAMLYLVPAALAGSVHSLTLSVCSSRRCEGTITSVFV